MMTGNLISIKVLGPMDDLEQNQSITKLISFQLLTETFFLFLGSKMYLNIMGYMELIE